MLGLKLPVLGLHLAALGLNLAVLGLNLAVLGLNLAALGIGCHTDKDSRHSGRQRKVLTPNLKGEVL